MGLKTHLHMLTIAVCAHVCLCVCLYVCVLVCVCICVCLGCGGGVAESTDALQVLHHSVQGNKEEWDTKQV